jgi:predicted TIM-barrel fold metal-dependent hydrolase
VKVDVHQHLWTEPFVEALSAREDLPFVRFEHGLTVLYAAGERPYLIGADAGDAGARAARAQGDGIDQALLAPSSPLGIEALPRQEAQPLIDSYLEGALGVGEPFGVWGALALDGADPDDVDVLLDRGCAGLSLPAAALGGVASLAGLAPVLERLESRGVPLFVHPGPAPSWHVAEVTLADPLWWPALTSYVAQMHAAWLAFSAVGRRDHPGLTVIFAMLAGLAPLQSERLRARGGSAGQPDGLTYFDTSSYGPRAVAAMEAAVGREQLVYGSDRPIADPLADGLDARRRQGLAVNAGRLLAGRRVAG